MDQDFNSINYKVVCILKAHPKARSSDKFLCETYYRVYENKNIPLTTTNTGIETLTRCRRKIQSKNPDLRAKEQVTENRHELSKDYRDFFSPNHAYKDMEDVF